MIKTTNKCLVLGANGFIGSHLVDRLAAESGIKVVAFDRFRRPAQFYAHQNVEIIKGDIHNDDQLQEAIERADYLIHCFSPTTPFLSDTDPYADIHNLIRTVRIFEMCAAAGLKKVVFISSGGAVYGRTAEQRAVSEVDAPSPVSPYGICKLSIEHYLGYFKRKSGLDYVTYRLTNPYGPRQIVKRRQGVIPSFLRAIDNNETIVVYGDGSASRDYIFINDAVDMIARTFRLPNRHSVYNIGSGQQTTTHQIIKALSRVYGKKIPIVYKEEPKTFLRKTDVSIDRFIDEFGEQRFTPFVEGLIKTVQERTMLQMDNSITYTEITE